jgi:hypothetical protein
MAGLLVLIGPPGVVIDPDPRPDAVTVTTSNALAAGRLRYEVDDR